MRTLRRLAYKLGRRPKPGSIFHSPSLDVQYGSNDAWLYLALALNGYSHPQINDIVSIVNTHDKRKK